MADTILSPNAPSGKPNRRDILLASSAAIAAAFTDMIASQKAFGTEIDERMSQEADKILRASWHQKGVSRQDMFDEDGSVRSSFVLFEMSEADADRLIAALRGEGSNHPQSNR